MILYLSLLQFSFTFLSLLKRKVGAEINVIQDIIRIGEINETKKFCFSSQINEMIKILVRLTKKKVGKNHQYQE